MIVSTNGKNFLKGGLVCSGLRIDSYFHALGIIRPEGVHPRPIVISFFLVLVLISLAFVFTVLCLFKLNVKLKNNTDSRFNRLNTMLCIGKEGDCLLSNRDQGFEVANPCAFQYQITTIPSHVEYHE